MNIDSIMKELAEYIRMGEQIAATLERLKNPVDECIRMGGFDYEMAD